MIVLKKLSYIHWLRASLSSLLCVLVLAIIVNVVIDPFFQYHKPLPYFSYAIENQYCQNRYYFLHYLLYFLSKPNTTVLLSKTVVQMRMCNCPSHRRTVTSYHTVITKSLIFCNNSEPCRFSINMGIMLA